jgi:hypothetical protein
MNYIIKLYKNNKIIHTRNTPVVINNRRITLTCSGIDKINLYDEIQRYIATYYYCFEQEGKITFEKEPYKI